MSGQDEARDPHLREALRHAPDAQLQAPPQLSELILQEARAKARDPKPADIPAPGWARSVWAWLARPAVATGFAGVMAATLVGLMWWDQPMDQAAPRSPVADTAPAPAITKAPASPVSALPPAGVTADAAKASRRDTAALPAPNPGTLAKKSAQVKESKRADTEQPARQQGTADEGRNAATLAPESSPAAAADRATQSQSRAEPVRESTAPPPASAAPGPFAGRAAAPARQAAKADFNDTRARLEAEAFTSIASLRAEVASEPSQWQWQRGDGTLQPMNDAVSAWLAQLDAATSRRWQPAQASSSVAQVTPALHLWRAGRLQHGVWLTEREALWQRGQTSWRVTLAPEQLATLKAALDSATP